MVFSRGFPLFLSFHCFLLSFSLVISGVTSTAIYRLKKTWAIVDKNTMSIFEELNTLLSRDNNFANFRKALHKIQPPALPYLGVYLTDMTFVDQGNPDLLTGTQLINFHKRRLLSFVIREIQQYQQLPYTYPRVDLISNYLTSLTFKSEDECYAQSLKIEPREDTTKLAAKANLPPGFDPPDSFDFDYPESFPFKDPDSEDNLSFMACPLLSFPTSACVFSPIFPLSSSHGIAIR